MTNANATTAQSVAMMNELKIGDRFRFNVEDEIFLVVSPPRPGTIGVVEEGRPDLVCTVYPLTVVYPVAPVPMGWEAIEADDDSEDLFIASPLPSDAIIDVTTGALMSSACCLRTRLVSEWIESLPDDFEFSPPLPPTDPGSEPLDEFTEASLEAALFSSTDESNEQGGEPLDRNYRAEDIHPETLAQMVADCQDFQDSFSALFGGEDDRAARDFWYTRNGHGAGFWDGDWDETYYELDADGHQTGRTSYPTLGDFLTVMSKSYGEFNLYVGDDGLIYGS